LAHVNHRLRGRASDADAAFVKKLARSLGWPYLEARRPIRAATGNLEEMARVTRYDALFRMARQKKAAAVLTAHTRDDQVETIFMNLLRGSGVAGVGGMSALRRWAPTKNWVGRPFLTVSKADVLGYLKSGRFLYRRDASNTNERFLRNWLRRTIFPQLEVRAPGFQERVARLAALARDEEIFWEDLLDEMNTKLTQPVKGGRLLDFEGLLRYSAAAQRRFLRRAMGGDVLAFDGVERLRRWMASAPTKGRIWQGKQGWMAERHPTSKTRFRIGKEFKNNEK
jgi:tRNA(Ile)-lysidine synthase